MVKDIICVACPMGCQISVELNDDGEILSVTGNTCKRGDAYARTECTHPERSPLFPSSPQRLFRRTRSRTASRR